MPSPAGSFQKKRLAKRLVSTSKAACDVQDLDAAFQVLQAAEILLRGTEFTAKDRRQVVGLIVGSHVVLWRLRHEARIDPVLASSLHVRAATLERKAGTTLPAARIDKRQAAPPTPSRGRRPWISLA